MLQVSTHLNWQRYLRLNVYLLLTSPMVFLMLCVGIGCLLYMLFYLLGWLPAQSFFPYPMLFLSLVLLVLVPWVSYGRIKRNFESSDRTKEHLEYTFDEQGMRVKGASFEAVSQWDMTYKVKENRWWFLIYQNRLMANVIVKEDLTEEEIKQLRTLVKNVEGWK